MTDELAEALQRHLEETNPAEAARRRLKKGEYLIVTPESFSGIRVPSIKTPEQAEQAIAELLGPVYEERTDLPAARARRRKH